METAEKRARLFVGIFFLAVTAGYAVYRRVSVADRLVSLDDVLREEAGDDLRALSEPSKTKLVPRLLAALKDGDLETRRNVACALADLGPRARAAAPLLRQLAEDEDPELRGCCSRALGKIGEGNKAH